MARHLRLLLSLFFLIGANLATAEKPDEFRRFESFGEYEVHFNAFSASLIDPSTAAAYDIQRSNNRAVLNITLLKKVPGMENQAVHGRVTASAINLTGQRRDIEMREVAEGDAIYYLGEFRIHHLETYDFTVEVSPDGATEPYTVKFRQQFYTE